MDSAGKQHKVNLFFPTLALLKCHHVVRNPGVDHREPNQTYWKSCVCYGVCWDELSLFLFVVSFFLVLKWQTRSEWMPHSHTPQWILLSSLKGWWGGVKFLRLEMICDLNFLLTREHVLCFVTFNLKMQEVWRNKSQLANHPPPPIPSPLVNFLILKYLLLVDHLFPVSSILPCLIPRGSEGVLLQVWRGEGVYGDARSSY